MAVYLDKHLAFIDSFQFMSSSLANLAKNLPDNKVHLNIRSLSRRKISLNEGERCLSS